MTGRPRVVPEQITRALDLCGLYGPDVDVACKAVEPAVDDWEQGKYEPTDEQLAALAELTGQPVGFFFRPFEAVPAEGWICWGPRAPRGPDGRSGRRCEPYTTDGVPVPPVVEARRTRAARNAARAAARGESALF